MKVIFMGTPTFAVPILNKLIEDGHMVEKWIYGHFHGHNEEEHDNIKYIALYNSDYIFDYHIF